jgi:hypothetical protein
MLTFLARRRTLIGSGVVAAAFIGLFLGLPTLFPIERAFSGGEFTRTFAEWTAAYASARHWPADPVNGFRLALLADFVFIPVYGALLGSIYVHLRGIGPEPTPTDGGMRWFDRTALGAIGAAMCLDAVENVGLLLLTARERWTPEGLLQPSISSGFVYAASATSALKWAAVALVVVLSVRALFSGTRGRILLLSRYTLISMLLGTVPLAVLPQGRDIISALAEGGLSMPLASFYVTLTLWGLTVWYSSRVLLDAAMPADLDGRYRGLARHLPRVLGALTILLPAVPIWSASKSLAARLGMIGGCVLLAAMFVVFVRRRHRWFRMARGPAMEGFSLRAARGQPASKIALIALAVSSMLFVLFVARPLDAGRVLGPVGILFIAAANTVFFGGLAVFASQVSGVRIDVLAMACAAAFSFWNDNHDVVPSRLDADLPSLEVLYREWRAALPTDAGGAPVFVVAAEGGGVRAAFWTATVLGGLSEGGTPGFGPRLFAVNGISGGTMGATVYAALRHDGVSPADLRRTAQSVLGRDLLSPIVAKLVSGDFAQWFLPIPIRPFDRSTGLEDALVSAYARATGGRDTMTRPVTTLKPDAASGVPAVVMNATIVESGGRAIVAPFTWTADQIPGATDYTCWVGECVDESDPKGHAAPNLAQAVHNSARFTYISPAGLVRTVGNARLEHVVDGGYFDPTGMDTLLDLVRSLRAIDGQHAFVPIYITNATVRIDANDRVLEPGPGDAGGFPGSAADSVPRAPHIPRDAKGAAPIELLGELFAPLQALLQAREAHGLTAVGRLPDAITFGFCPMDKNGSAWHELSPEEIAKSEEKRPEPPLGWQLSPAMTERLDAYWTTCHVNRAGAQAIATILARAHVQ